MVSSFINVDGYYYCECNNMPGTRLDADRHTCTGIEVRIL